MFDTIFACIFLVAGLAMLAYATLGRWWGFHRAGKWEGGGQVSLTGELACGIFILCLGLAALHGAGVLILPALAAWIVGYISQERAKRRHAAAEDALRERNAAKHPGIFDQPPPYDIDQQEEELDVYDAGACTYLGRGARRDLQVLIERYGADQEGPNDIFVIPESLEIFPAGTLGPEFVALLQKAFAERDYLVLRWLPPGKEHGAGQAE
jgi:hypothetical protein